MSSVVGITWDDAAPECDRMPDIIRRFQADRDCLERLTALRFSPARLDRMTRFYREWRRHIDGFPFESMTLADRADWLLLRQHVETHLRFLRQDRDRFALVAPVIPCAEALIALNDDRIAMLDVRPEAAAATLNSVGEAVSSLRQSFRDNTITIERQSASFASQVIRQIQDALREWFQFYDGYDPMFSWWVEKSFGSAMASLDAYAIFLREHVAGVSGDEVIGLPIGKEALIAELREAQVHYEPGDLIAAAKRELIWCRQEFARAARELGVGDSWRDAVECAKRDYTAPGEQPALVRDLAFEAIDYVEELDLISVPEVAKQGWRMDMMSAEKQKINPFFLGGETIIMSYPTRDMDFEQKLMSLRGNNRAFTRATVQHELIPGHHLQMFSQERYRPYRQMFYTPFWIEGWTLHWEMLLWELGFPRTPKERVGMLFWRQHRCLRVIFSLEYHLGLLTEAECVEMLVCEAGHERANAVAEVRRSLEADYPPLYQCAYLIGGMQMHALHAELVHGGRMSHREFHDAVMKQNCMPIPTLRAVLLGEDLSSEGLPEWHFLAEEPVPA